MHKIGGWFKGLFRRPVSRIITPALGTAAIATIVFAPDSNGFSLFNSLAALVGLQPDGTMGARDLTQVNNIPGHIVSGTMAAVPLMIGTAIAGLAGRILKI